MAKLKNISFVMPVLNEEKYLETAVTSVFEQKTPGKKELVIALGPTPTKTIIPKLYLDKMGERIGALSDIQMVLTTHLYYQIV